MKIEELIWLDNIVQKLIQKHNVEQEEVEEILTNNPHIRFVEKGDHYNEDLYAALGQTDAGRYLIIYFINKGKHQALIISARDMTKNEKKLYDKAK